MNSMRWFLWEVLTPTVVGLGLLTMPLAVFATGLTLELGCFWAGALEVVWLVAIIVGAERLEFKITMVEVIVLQLLVFVLYALLLDMGIRLGAFIRCELGYLGGAGLVWARRPKSLTPGDRLYLKWGWVPIIAVGVGLALQYWKWKRVI
jgi:hypothetical protein